MFVDRQDQNLIIDPRNQKQLAEAIGAFHSLIAVTYPDVKWSYVAEQTSRIANGLEASNIIALQVKQIMLNNQIAILRFNVEDL